MSTIVSGFIGLLSLLAGRQLYWVFVGAAGFLIAFNLAEQYFGVQSEFLLLVLGLAAGVLGAVLAVVAQRLAVAVAGFIAGGFLLVYGAQLLGMQGENLDVVLFIVGGVVGALLISVLFDPALVILSSLLGASILSQTAQRVFDVPQAWYAAILVILFIIGVIVQFSAWQPVSRSVREKRDA